MMSIKHRRQGGAMFQLQRRCATPILGKLFKAKVYLPASTRGLISRLGSCLQILSQRLAYGQPAQYVLAAFTRLGNGSTIDSGTRHDRLHTCSNFDPI